MSEIPDTDDLRAAEEVIDATIHQLLEEAFGATEPCLRQLLWTQASELNERLRKTKRARLAEAQ